MSVCPCGCQPVWWLGLSLAMGKCPSLLLCFVKVVLVENIPTAHRTAFVLSRRHRHKPLTSGSKCNLSRPYGIGSRSYPLVFPTCYATALCLFCCLPAAPLLLTALSSAVVFFSGMAVSHHHAADGKMVAVRLQERWLQLTFLYKFGAIHSIGDL